MKKQFLSVCFGLSLLVLASALLASPDQNRQEQMTLGITSLAASSTNITTAISSNVTFQTGPSACRIYLTANGTAATTNGFFKVTFATSPDGTTFDTATLTNATITLSFTSLGTSTNTVSDWFNVSGVRAIRAARYENTFLGPVTNMVIKVGYPTQ